MKKNLFLAHCMAIPLAGCTGSNYPETSGGGSSSECMQQSDVMSVLKEAYIYAFPLVLMDATKTVSINTERPGNGKAPINQFLHGDNTADAEFKTVVTPNVDTVYSQVWLDLSVEPLIFTMPDTDRFFNVQLLDAWTNTADVLTKPGSYAITSPVWNGILPQEVTRINIPTDTAWFIGRCILKNRYDIENVTEIQNKMSLVPLSAYISEKEYKAPKGAYKKENDYVPVDKVFSMGFEEFFTKANELMIQNPPSKEDKDILKKISAVNVGPGLKFDKKILGADVPLLWSDFIKGLKDELIRNGSKFSVKMGQWSYFGRPIGDFGTEYDYRAMIALGGLGANTLDVALYAKTDTDDTGERMSGKHTYRIHFSSVPPVLEKGFWSVTAYGSDDFLIDNHLKRYCINDRSYYAINDDGTFDITVSANEPENVSNWLPVNEDEFHLYMRIYYPDMDRINKWTAPVITVKE